MANNVLRMNPRLRYYALVNLVLLLGVWLRLWQLNITPPGLWFDEAYYAMDAVWIRDTHTWPVFLLGNNGREAMFSYLLSLSTMIWGETIYTVRLIPALLGIFSLPILYRWGLTLFQDDSRASWLALVSTAGLATSFLYVTMNRSSYRANLLPLFVLLVSYFFWRGWQTGKTRYYLLAGGALGLSQYTYLSARLLPLAFILFVFSQSLSFWQSKRWMQLKNAWLHLFLMGIISALVAMPLLLFFLAYPEAFWGRVSDVAVKVGWSVEGLKTFGLHLLAAIRVLIDGEDPNWRHHLGGRPGFDWFSTLGFWLGLVIVIKSYRRPANQFLLSLFFIMGLPALLSEPAFNTLRLSGMLPIYYIFMAIGLINALSWLTRRLPIFARLGPAPAGFLTVFLVLVISGGVTIYDYFYRWAGLAEVYAAYDGPVVDLARQLTTPAETNVVIPFYLYTHASMRYLLHSHYREEILMPTEIAAQLSQQAKTPLVIPVYPPDDHLSPAFVWLVKGETGPGVAYVSAVSPFAGVESQPDDRLRGSRDNEIAYRYEINTEEMLALFPQQLPAKKAAVTWGDNLRLTGYEFSPPAITPGSSSSLVLAWDILGYTSLTEKMFIQMLDSQGQPVSQQELEPISRKLYRWRPDNFIFEQYPLRLPANVPAGLYFVRLGYFNPKTGQRLQAYDSNKQSLGDEIILGPLYVSRQGINPVSPRYPIEARLGQAIDFLGFSLSSPEDGSSIEVELFWKTRQPVDKDYTAFVQLLDNHNNVIAQHDAVPLNGLYPASRWQPGDIISDKFILSIPAGALSENTRLVTGLYDLVTGVRLPVYSPGGDLQPDNVIQLRTTFAN